ncbi:MAG: hypothetical protein CYPHOPRED_000290 [Cyphobasidiales sp. Tagirdzhanova-0007]|nr:MAG: hypothetical protein CYPHOPRED_000290 [Cyphobasidiales sp. Tagirdzhanova-0007]
MDSTTPEEEQLQSILGAKQAAQYFRENVVQGVSKDDRKDTYALRIHPSIALGNNSSIKDSTPAPSLHDIKFSMNSSSVSSRASSSSSLPHQRRRSRKSSSETAPTGDDSGSAATNHPDANWGTEPERSNETQGSTNPGRPEKSSSGTAPAGDNSGSAATNYNDASRGMGKGVQQ